MAQTHLGDAVDALPAEPDTRTPGAVESRAVGDIGFDRRRREAVLWTLAAVITTGVVVTFSVSVGSVAINPDVVWKVIGHHVAGVPGEKDWTATQDNIVWLVRVPRVLLGLAVGAGLAISGCAIQAVVRNVLADPYLLGVSSGASCGAALTLLFGVGAGLGANSLSISAFVGALGALGLVLTLARMGGKTTAIRLVLAGVAVGYALSAVTGFLVFAADTRDGVRALTFWLLGGLDQARWSSVALPWLLVVVTLAVLVVFARSLDALALGDAAARSLGVHPDRTRNATFVLVALCVGGCVAVSGTIGFVGLIVPHVVRRFVGAEHRLLLPIAALTGGTFLVLADVVARTAFSPRELPIGIVTAIVGTPFIAVLLRRNTPIGDA